MIKLAKVSIKGKAKKESTNCETRKTLNTGKESNQMTRDLDSVFLLNSVSFPQFNPIKINKKAAQIICR